MTERWLKRTPSKHRSGKEQTAMGQSSPGIKKNLLLEDFHKISDGNLMSLSSKLIPKERPALQKKRENLHESMFGILMNTAFRWRWRVPLRSPIEML
jgi:hypothetical protein